MTDSELASSKPPSSGYGVPRGLLDPPLDLVGFVAGSRRLIRIGLRGAARWLVRDARHSCLRRFDVLLCRFGIRFPGFVQLIAEFVLRFLELLHSLAHSPCELGQFLCAEQNEDDQQNDDQIRPGQVHEAGKKAHK